MYFEEKVKGGRRFHQARTVFVDTDPVMVEQATQHTTTFFDSEACHSSSGRHCSLFPLQHIDFNTYVWVHIWGEIGTRKGVLGCI